MTGCRHVFEYAYVPDGSPTNTFWHKCKLCGIRVVGDARKMWEECAADIAARDAEIERLRNALAASIESTKGSLAEIARLEEQYARANLVH